jgi:hypothetical protein
MRRITDDMQDKCNVVSVKAITLEGLASVIYIQSRRKGGVGTK